MDSCNFKIATLRLSSRRWQFRCVATISSSKLTKLNSNFAIIFFYRICWFSKAENLFFLTLAVLINLNISKSLEFTKQEKNSKFQNDTELTSAKKGETTVFLSCFFFNQFLTTNSLTVLINIDQRQSKLPMLACLENVRANLSYYIRRSPWPSPHSSASLLNLCVDDSDLTKESFLLCLPVQPQSNRHLGREHNLFKA